MRRPANAVFLAALVLSSAICGAQVPFQFKGLLTTTTDYTCAGVVPCPTWPMPDLPPAGGSYTDPTWGTTIYRLAVPAENPGTAYSTYSRVQAWNSDNTKMFLSEAPGMAYMDLYDATTTPPTPINRITTTDNTFIDSMNSDALWAYTDPNRIYYVPAFQKAHSMELRYVDVSKCTKSNCELKPVIVHSFSCKTDATSSLGAGVSGNTIETGSGAQGGMFDSTDRYFSFSCDNVNEAGRTEIDFIRYDRTLDKVTTQVKWYTVCAGGEPKGCEVFKECPRGMGKCDTNIFRMNQHPDARYITVLWQCATSLNSKWKIGCGTAAYGPTYNFLGPISVGNYHQDNGFDVNGIPTWVGITTFFGVDASDNYSLEVVNLTTLSTSGITSKQLKLPCTVAYGGPSCTSPFLGSRSEHISMTGTWGSVPGYALFSTLIQAGQNGGGNVDKPLATTLGTAVSAPGVATVMPGTMTNIGVGTQQLIDYGSANIETVTVTAVTSTTFTATFAKTHTASAPVSNLTAGDTGPFTMENLAIKIDTTAANPSNVQVWRLGRAMSVRDADYNAEPHTAVNRDFTQFTWGSNWNSDGGRDYGFWTKLPAAAPKASHASASLSAKPE
jgi:hypothetical protein